MRIIRVYKGMFSAETDTYIFENGAYNDYYETILWLCAYTDRCELKSLNWDNINEKEKMLVRDEIDDPNEWYDTFNYMWEVADK